MDFSWIMGSTYGMPSFVWAHAVFDARVREISTQVSQELCSYCLH